MASPAVVAEDIEVPKELLPEIPPLPIGDYRVPILTTLGILLGLFLLGMLWRWYRRSTALPALPLTSYQQLLSDLKKSRQLLGQAPHFCSALCFALKSYLQREYHLPLTCRTTEEFLNLFSKSTQFSWQQVALLSDVLQSSDVAKFAREALTEDVQKELFIKTCRFARFVRIHHRKPKSTPAT
ncbi:MAG: hypothetical protein K2L24_03835 [Opitutales bacterium]|nr:hypothetical protein [Opitutales bacterium]